jgi:hypothetical protein
MDILALSDENSAFIPPASLFQKNESNIDLRSLLRGMQKSYFHFDLGNFVDSRVGFAVFRILNVTDSDDAIGHDSIRQLPDLCLILFEAVSPPVGRGRGKTGINRRVISADFGIKKVPDSL